MRGENLLSLLAMQRTPSRTSLLIFGTTQVVVSGDVVFDEELPTGFELGVNETDVCASDVTNKIVECPVKLDGDDGYDEVEHNKSITDESNMRVGDVDDVNTIEVNVIGHELIETLDGDGENVQGQHKLATAADHKDETGTQNYVTKSNPSIALTGKITRSGRVSKPPGTSWKAYLVTEHHNALVARTSREFPQSFRETNTGPDADIWKRGIASDIFSSKKHKVWRMAPRSKTMGPKFPTSTWVFVETQKFNDYGSSSTYAKARNVVRGFLQMQGLD